MVEETDISYGACQVILTKYEACLSKAHSTSSNQEHENNLSVCSDLPQYAQTTNGNILKIITTDDDTFPQV
jgi:hypothetical protein